MKTEAIKAAGVGLGQTGVTLVTLLPALAPRLLLLPPQVTVYLLLASLQSHACVWPRQCVVVIWARRTLELS